MTETLRTLNNNELDTVRRALEMLADADERQSEIAESMLEQKMPENFFWRHTTL